MRNGHKAARVFDLIVTILEQIRDIFAQLSFI